MNNNIYCEETLPLEFKFSEIKELHVGEESEDSDALILGMMYMTWYNEVEEDEKVRRAIKKARVG
jgi:hypothetical protein